MNYSIGIGGSEVNLSRFMEKKWENWGGGAYTVINVLLLLFADVGV